MWHFNKATRRERKNTRRNSSETNKIKSRVCPSSALLNCAGYRIDLILICIKLHQISGGERSRRTRETCSRASLLETKVQKSGGCRYSTKAPRRSKDPYCVKSISRKKIRGKRGGGFERKGKTRDGGRQEGGRRERKLAALPSMPAVCEKAAVAYWGLHNILGHTHISKAARGCVWMCAVPSLSQSSPLSLYRRMVLGWVGVFSLCFFGPDSSLNEPSVVRLFPLTQNVKRLHPSASLLLLSIRTSCFSTLLIVFLYVRLTPGVGGWGSNPPDCEMQNLAVERMCMLCNFLHLYPPPTPPLSPRRSRLRCQLDVSGCIWASGLAYGGCGCHEQPVLI